MNRMNTKILAASFLSAALILSCSNVDRTNPETVIASWSSSGNASSSAISSQNPPASSTSSSLLPTSSSSLVQSSSSVCANTYPTATTINDCRDANTYKVTTIGSQTWLAQDLRYQPPGFVDTWCNVGSGTSTVCERYYSWERAKTVCPYGWHLPTLAEWDTLTTSVGGISIAGAALKSNSTDWGESAATTTYANGFNALPNGDYNDTSTSNGFYEYVGTHGKWWTATPATGSTTAYIRRITSGTSYLYTNEEPAVNGLTVRCVKDSV